MMTEELTKCPSCGFDEALTHYSSGNEVNWIACPRCRKYFEHGVEIPPAVGDDEVEAKFWKNVEEDTGYGAVKK